MKKVNRKVKKNQKISISLEDFKLNKTDHKVLQYQMKYPSLTQREIAKILGISEEQISRITHKPAYKRAYKFYTDSALETIKLAKDEAARTLKLLLRAKSEMVRLMAARLFLKKELELSEDREDEENILTFKGWD